MPEGDQDQGGVPVAVAAVLGRLRLRCYLRRRLLLGVWTLRRLLEVHFVPSKGLGCRSWQNDDATSFEGT